MKILKICLLFRIFNIENVRANDICSSTGYKPYDYPQALCMSLMFYEAQRSGKLPPNQRITWRKDAALNDGMDNDVDLEGGYFDAGDYVKFGYPMAFTITALAWGLIAYPEGYKIAGETEHIIEAIEWGAKYLLKAKTGPTELWVQVGDPAIDHKYWGRPEDMKMDRPSYKVDSLNPGSDVAAETAAALAATFIIFKDENSTFAFESLNAARDLFDFAEQYRDRYQNSVPKAKGFYDSYSYGDELTWSALWLFKATGEVAYLNKAKLYLEEFGILNYAHNFDWDSKNPGIYALLVELDANETYIHLLEKYVTHLILEEKYTPKGLVYIGQWGSLRQAMNCAFIAIRASSLGIRPLLFKSWAQKQLDYALGSTGRSFVVGFGKNPPRQPHHKAASCPNPPADCNMSYLTSSSPNPNILYGALVGGPDERDLYIDIRLDFIHNEVSCDYNALFTGLLAALIQTENVHDEL